MDTSSSVRPATATHKAYAALKALIMNNTLMPSASYLEAELADRLGVSRTPVREALQQLQSEGLVEVRPRHGMRVLPISAGDMQEIYDILTELEPLAADLAARRGLNDDQVAAMEASIDRMEDSLARADRHGWAEADDAFHNQLVRHSGSKRLQRVVGQFRDQVHRARMATLHLREMPVQSNADHRAVLSFIVAGDGPAARLVHRRHRERAGELLVDLLARHGLDNL